MNKKRGTSHPKTQKADFEICVGTVLPADTLCRTSKKFKERNPWPKGKANTPPHVFGRAESLRTIIIRHFCPIIPSHRQIRTKLSDNTIDSGISDKNVRYSSIRGQQCPIIPSHGQKQTKVSDNHAVKGLSDKTVG